MCDDSKTDIEKIIEECIAYHKNDIDKLAPLLPLALLLKVNSNLIDRLKEAIEECVRKSSINN